MSGPTRDTSRSMPGVQGDPLRYANLPDTGLPLAPLSASYQVSGIVLASCHWRWSPERLPTS
jgi:hypothetical protein